MTAKTPFLPEIFELHGKWRANKPAIMAAGKSLNWRQFDERLNQVANGLHKLGLNKGDRVIVLMSNGMAMAECLFGIMKAGLVSAPLNTSVSDDAILGMIIDSGASAIIASSDQASRLETMSADIPEQVRHTRIVEGYKRSGWTIYEPWRDEQSITPPDVKIASDDILNIIYSSGTTGTPKGIVHTHQGRRDWAYDLAIALRYHGASRFLATIGLYSNISWVGMLCALLAGGTLIIADKFDANDLWRQIEMDKITHLCMVPIMYQRMMELENHQDYDASSLVAMMSAGSPLHENVRASMFARFPAGVIELYGLTEGVITTLEPEDAKGRMASVGLPLIGTDLLILDDENKECPAGIAGEILSRGRIVMPGYLNRPEETASAFWTDKNQRQWLRTGDIGYVDDDGFLYIVDRKKDMILSGGQNIYPQDIEAVLVRHKDVSDAAVIGVKSHKWGETPLAIVATENGDGDVTQIKKWVNERVGKQQRLVAVTKVEEIPRNPNGKILKRKLRQQFTDIIYD